MGWGDVDEKESIRTIHTAIDLGVNIFEADAPRTPQLAVVDEDFLPSLIRQGAWSVGKLFADPVSICAEVVTVLQAGEPLLACRRPSPYRRMA